MKKDYITSPHQLDLLEKYYPVDREKKIVTIKIYYEKATDMLDFSVGELHKEMLANEVLEKITEITDKIPVDYKANIIFVIDDFCEYTAEAIIEKLNDLIEINNYQIIHEKKRNCIIAAILVLVGFILLFLLGIEKKYDWLSEGLAKDVLEEIFDITSWVFIWQAVTILFLMPSDLVKIGVKFITKIQTISISNKQEQILITENQSSIVENFEIESKAAQFRKTALLVTSTIILAIGIYTSGNSVTSFVDNYTNENALEMYIGLVIGFISNFITISTGVVGIRFYRGDQRARKPLHVLSILMAVSLTFTTISFILLHNYFQVFQTVVLILVEALFVYCSFVGEKKSARE